MNESSATVRAITPTQTHDLRRRVLRAGLSDEDVDVIWAGDDADDTVHFGAFVGSRIAAISTWLVVPYPDDPLIRAVQLRGMATDPTDIGRGLGAQLLRAGRLHAASIKAEIIWANARLTALGFYERNGFEAVGPTFATADTGLAHRRVLTTVNSVTETGLD